MARVVHLSISLVITCAYVCGVSNCVCVLLCVKGKSQDHRATFWSRVCLWRFCVLALAAVIALPNPAYLSSA
jgi:hypothetical protein